MIKSFVTVLNLLLATALVYLGVTVFYSVVSARMEQGQLTAQNDRQVVSDNRSPRRSLVFYNAINRRNLFNIDRSRPTRTKPIQVEKLEQTRLKLKLWGTAIGSDGIEYAVIQSGREQQLYHLGDAVDRATLKAILKGKVVLHVDGRDEILELERPSAKTVSDLQSPGPGRFARPIRIGKAQIEDAAANINELLQQVTIRPSFEDGQPNGLMLSRIKRGSIFNQMGLKNGDILTGVNGEAIQSVDQALSFYNDLKSAGDVKLEIKRRGQPHIIEYTID